MRAPPAPAEQLTSAMASIQQSFTTEASAVLTAAVSDASRRHHPHATPVHVAAALLSAPSSLLRRTCMMHQEQHQHHPTHPFLSCRALDLCFSVALDRMASIPSHLSSPVFSNALVASLKRAQAIQRRGSPDHPLLAIRVDLPHLTISILDDPSVSRVMGEAGFSSPRVKSSILSCISPKHIHGREIGLAVSGYRQEIKRVADVLMRQQKRNPVLVGDTGVDVVMKDVLGMMRRGDFGNLNVISVGDSLSRAKTNELPGRIRGIVNTVSFKLLHDKGVVLDLGDLKWLVDAQNEAVLPKHTMEERRQVLMSTARAVISEVASILRQERRMWVVGTATCATYLKCQVYHPNMESDWELQALPITPRSLVGVLSSSNGKGGIPGSSVGALNASNDRAFSINNSVIPLNWNQEKQSTSSRGSPGLCRFCLKQHGDESSCVAERHQLERYNIPREIMNRLLDGPLFFQKEGTLNETAIDVDDKWQGSSLRIQHQLELAPTSPGSISSTRHRLSHSEPTVQTDLSLRLAPFSATKSNSDRCDDVESQISLSKGLSREVNWQPEAVASISSIMQSFKSGSCKRYRCDESAVWLLFNGPDDIGKRKMAHALSILVFHQKPVTFDLSTTRDSTSHERSITDCGRTQLDLLVEAVKENPKRVIVLDGIDQADAIVRTTIKNAIVTGQFVDSDDQEIGGLRDTIFILILGSEQARQEMKLFNWHLQLFVGPNTRKRRVEHEQNEERRNRPRTISQTLSLDLNLCAGSCLSVHDDDEDEENDDGDSDLTEENDHNIGQCTDPFPVPSSISDISHLLESTDFKPFDLGKFKLTLSKIITAKFALVMGSALHLEIEMHALDHIADVVLQGDGGIFSFEQWVDNVFVPVVEQLKSSSCLKNEDKIYLSAMKDRRLSGTTSGHGTHLPISVTMTLDAT